MTWATSRSEPVPRADPGREQALRFLNGRAGPMTGLRRTITASALAGVVSVLAAAPSAAAETAPDCDEPLAREEAVNAKRPKKRRGSQPLSVQELQRWAPI